MEDFEVDIGIDWGKGLDVMQETDSRFGIGSDSPERTKDCCIEIDSVVRIV